MSFLLTWGLLQDLILREREKPAINRFNGILLHKYGKRTSLWLFPPSRQKDSVDGSKLDCSNSCHESRSSFGLRRCRHGTARIRSTTIIITGVPYKINSHSLNIHRTLYLRLSSFMALVCCKMFYAWLVHIPPFNIFDIYLHSAAESNLVSFKYWKYVYGFCFVVTQQENHPSSY